MKRFINSGKRIMNVISFINTSINSNCNDVNDVRKNVLPKKKFHIRYRIK